MENVPHQPTLRSPGFQPQLFAAGEHSVDVEEVTFVSRKSAERWPWAQRALPTH